MTDSVLVVAAHPDDEVLGCGGSIARWAKEGRDVYVLILADGVTSRPVPEGEEATPLVTARKSAANNANEILGAKLIDLLSLPDNRLDTVPLLDIVKIVEAAIRGCHPGTVLVHHRGDVNIDHQVAHEAVIAACRPQPDFCVRELLFFEVPSSTEWRPPGSAEPFLPNYFVDISATLETKLTALAAYEEELRQFPHSRSIQAIEALARWRGATCGMSAAEAYCLGRKLV